MPPGTALTVAPGPLPVPSRHGESKRQSQPERRKGSPHPLTRRRYPVPLLNSAQQFPPPTAPEERAGAAGAPVQPESARSAPSGRRSVPSEPCSEPRVERDEAAERGGRAPAPDRRQVSTGRIGMVSGKTPFAICRLPPGAPPSAAKKPMRGSHETTAGAILLDRRRFGSRRRIISVRAALNRSRSQL